MFLIIKVPFRSSYTVYCFLNVLRNYSTNSFTIEKYGSHGFQIKIWCSEKISSSHAGWYGSKVSKGFVSAEKHFESNTYSVGQYIWADTVAYLIMKINIISYLVYHLAFYDLAIYIFVMFSLLGMYQM